MIRPALWFQLGLQVRQALHRLLYVAQNAIQPNALFHFHPFHL